MIGSLVSLLIGWPAEPNDAVLHSYLTGLVPDSGVQPLAMSACVCVCVCIWRLFRLSLRQFNCVTSDIYGYTQRTNTHTHIISDSSVFHGVRGCACVCARVTERNPKPSVTHKFLVTDPCTAEGRAGLAAVGADLLLSSSLLQTQPSSSCPSLFSNAHISAASQSTPKTPGSVAGESITGYISHRYLF